MQRCGTEIRRGRAAWHARRIWLILTSWLMVSVRYRPMVLISWRFIYRKIRIAERLTCWRLVCLRHMSVGVSVFRNTGLGGSDGDYVLYLVFVDIVMGGVLIAAARVAVLALVAIKCRSVDYILVGAWMPAIGVVWCLRYSSVWTSRVSCASRC